MQKIVDWMLSLHQWQNVLISLTFLLLLLILVLGFCSWLFDKFDKMDDDFNKVKNIPTEEELRRQKEKGARRAFMAYTRNDDGKTT